MGDKKQKEARMKAAKKVLVVGACIVFVVLMIVSGMGTSWLTMFTVTKPGDKVVVDYTLYDINGRPFLTTNQQIYTQAASKGENILIGDKLRVTAGQNLTTFLVPVLIYTGQTGWDRSFAIFAPEYDAIDQALLGMRQGDQQRIRLPNASMSQMWDKDTLERNNMSLDSLLVGDTLAMAVSDNPEAMSSNSSVTYTRFGEITAKSDDGVVIDFGYPYADISVAAINPTS